MAKKKGRIVYRSKKTGKKKVHHKPKTSLIKAAGLAAGAYMGAFGPSRNEAPQNAFELLKTNPAWAGNDLVDSVMGYNGNNQSWDFGELQFFYGPVIAGYVIDYVARKLVPGLAHMKVPGLKNVVVA